VKKFAKICLCLFISSSLVFLPAYAVLATDEITTPSEETSPSEIPSETPSETPSDEPTEEPGSEWSGEIIDPAGESIARPAENTAPAGAATAEVIVTPPAASSNSQENATSSVRTITAPESSESTKTSESTETSEPTEAAEVTTETSETITTEDPEVSSEPAILVPDTNRPNTTRKIHLMALLSTTILVFTVICFFSSLKAYELSHLNANKTTKARNSAKNKTKKFTKNAKNAKSVRATKTKVKAQRTKKLKKSSKISAKDTNPLLLK